MKRKIGLACGVFLAAGVLSTQTQAGTVFSDDFNSYAFQLNWVPSANWTAPGPGAVDLIGETTTQTQFDFYPGHGGYVDLNGTNGVPGTLQTITNFAPGAYTLAFDLGGNALGDGPKTTVVTLGNISESITLNSGDPLTQYLFSFTTTTSGQLSFADLAGGNGNIGNILDNVTLSTGLTRVSGVPEASTWAMMFVGFLGLGLMGYRRSGARLRLA